MMDIRRKGKEYLPAFVAYAVTRGLETGAHQERGMLEWVADDLDVTPAWLARRIAGAYRQRVIAGHKRRVLVDPELAPADRERFDAWAAARQIALDEPPSAGPVGVRRPRDARARAKAATRGRTAARNGGGRHG